MSYNRFRIHSSRSASSSGTPVSRRHFRLSQATPAPAVVDTNPASHVSSSIDTTTFGATRSLSILIEDSDSSSSIASLSVEPNLEAHSTVNVSTSQPEVQLDRSIPTNRTLLDTEINFPVYSTVRTSRFPVLSTLRRAPAITSIILSLSLIGIAKIIDVSDSDKFKRYR
ncbi:hypothetical protein BDF21DRAFT_409976 [Thamnidium elegans]|nr:hypothetical protein BDF21DRAFT_409976 [Thamnidium elegans]